MSWNSNCSRWRAQLCQREVVHHLGYFDSEVAAARHYDLSVLRMRGPTALTNFPLSDYCQARLYCFACVVLGLLDMSTAHAVWCFIKHSRFYHSSDTLHPFPLVRRPLQGPPKVLRTALAVKDTNGGYIDLAESDYLGVSRVGKSRWVAEIWDGRKYESLGLFCTEDAAARAYDQACVEMYGAEANVNFPEEHMSDDEGDDDGRRITVDELEANAVSGAVFAIHIWNIKMVPISSDGCHVSSSLMLPHLYPWILMAKAAASCILSIFMSMQCWRACHRSASMRRGQHAQSARASSLSQLPILSAPPSPLATRSPRRSPRSCSPCLMRCWRTTSRAATSSLSLPGALAAHPTSPASSPLTSPLPAWCFFAFNICLDYAVVFWFYAHDCRAQSHRFDFSIELHSCVNGNFSIFPNELT